MTSPLQQKIKVTGPVIVTANRLGDGKVIYRTGTGGWTTRLDGAAVVTNTTAATELLRGAADDDIGAVGAYVASVQIDRDGQVRPANLRERIRCAGPTIELPANFGA